MNSREVLQEAKLRITAPRLAVLEALAAMKPHQNAEAIAATVRARIGTLSTQSVYDNLHALVGAGIARRIEPAGSAALYELRAGDNHHHLVCRECGAVQDVDCVVGKAPCLHPQSTQGFDIDEAEVTFWGICSSCQGKSELNKTAICPEEEN
jgi:Fur family ferric uptake transcriptional regulator